MPDPRDHIERLQQAQFRHMRRVDARHLCHQAAAAQAEDDLAEARRYYRESIEIWREIEDQRGLLDGLEGLADVELLLGHRDEARALYTEALETAHQTRDRVRIESIEARLAGLA